MAELTDRDRETMYKIFGDRDHWMIDPKTWDKVAIALAIVREESRREAIEECARIADGGAALLDGIEIKFVTPEKLATDLAKDIADGIRSLGKEST